MAAPDADLRAAVQYRVCICDATLEELEMVNTIKEKCDAFQERAHARWQAVQFRNHERAMKASESRRENARKRRREEKAEARKRREDARTEYNLSDAFTDSDKSSDGEGAYMSEGGTVHGADWD